MFCAHLAVKVPKVQFPSHWKKGGVAKKLHATIPHLDTYLAGFGSRTAATWTLERLLRAFRLPPAAVRPILIESQLVKKIPVIGRIVHAGIQAIRCEPAWAWLLS